MYLPHIISSIDNSLLTHSNPNYDFTKNLYIKRTAQTHLFLLLTIQSIKNIADPQKYGNHIINDLYHLLNLHPAQKLHDLVQITQKIDNNYSKAFYIQFILSSIQTNNNTLRYWAVSNQPTHILLKRNTKIIKLPVAMQGIDGPLEPTDLLIQASSEFIDQTSNIQIATIFKNPSVGLNAIQNTTKPAMMIAIKNDGITPAIMPKKPDSSAKKNKLHTQTIRGSLSQLKQPKAILNSVKIGKRRKLALAISFIFFIMLSITLTVGYQKRQQMEQERIRQQLSEEVQYRLQQAQSLKNLNSQRAKTLLQEAKTILEQYQQDHQNVDLNLLSQQVNQAYAEVSKQYIITQPDIFFSLDLVKDGFKSTQSYLNEDTLTVLDQSQQTIIQLNTDQKSAQIVAGPDIVPLNSQLAAIPTWIFLTSAGKLQIIDPKEQEQLKSFTLSTIQVDQLIGYGNNAYVLDKKSGQLWRFRGTRNGLNKPDGFFKEETNLSQISLAAIDGSVWFLRTDGGIEKYTTGIKDAYYAKLDLDIPLSNPTAFFTSDKLDYLYILDPDNKRVVVLTKQAQYVSQYIWDQIDQSTQLAVSQSNNKLLLIKGDKIHAIDLRD